MESTESEVSERSKTETSDPKPVNVEITEHFPFFLHSPPRLHSPAQALVSINGKANSQCEEKEKVIQDYTSNLHILKLEEKSDKADSGMDDDSQPSNGQGEEDVDDEEEIITRKPRSKKAIFDDDDSEKEDLDEQKDVCPDSTVKLKTADEVLDIVMNDEGSESSNNSSSSDDDDKETLLSTIKKRKKLVKRTKIDSESEDDQDIKTDVGQKESKPKSLFGNSDLFDAEEESDNNAQNSGEETASDSNHEGDDEGFDEAAIDPKLLKKLKKGASKKASKPKKTVEQEEKLKLHSETQRLIRESRVNIPYHQPEPKALTDFLARATSKQQQYRALRGARDSTKAKAVEEILQKTKLSSKDKVEDKCVNSATTCSDKSDATENTDSKDIDTNCEVTKDDDCDSLPELDDHVTEDKEQCDSHVTKQSQVDSEEMKLDNTVDNVLSKSDNICTDTKSDFRSNETESESKHNADSSPKDACHSPSDDVEDENKENECSDNTNGVKPSKHLSSKLAGLTELPPLPKLSGGPKHFIDLDVNTVSPSKPGVNKLMDRFMEHAKKKHKHVHKDIELSVIQKEKTEADKEELKLSTFVYHVSEDEEDSMSQFDAPGAKLVALKEKLKQKMKVKREEHRKQRQEIFDLDNEEGYVEDGEDKVLDDEEEMTDESDTDIEDEEFDEQFGEEEMEEKEENPFCDNEAEEDDDDDGMELRLHLSDDDEDEDNKDKTDTVNSDDEDSKPSRPSSLKKKPKVLAISDDEESKASFSDEKVQEETENKPGESKCNESLEEDTFTPFSKHILKSDCTQPENKKGRGISVDESQDCGGPNLNTSQGSLYIEESQMLDADGFLKFGSEKKVQQASSDSPNFKNLLQTQESGDMNELLGLCSGRFVEDDNRTSCKNLFGSNTQSGQTQGNMDELLGLCSGKFVSNTQSTQKPLGSKRKADFDEDSNSSLQMVSDTEEGDFMEKEERAFSDDDAEEVDEDSNSVSSKKPVRPFKGITGKSGKIRREFVDEEAELSGSEYDSDENLDLAEEDDIMEEELGDNDVTATEEELRNQVGRAHLKQMIDDDKRELMRFQEMYLPDGDLHSDAGRTRRFKWNNADDDTQQDIFDEMADEEKEEDDGEEAKWRQDRYEREKWLQENEKQVDEDSQFLKLGKCFLKRRDSDSSLLKKPEVPPLKKQSSATPVPKLSRRGSFLGRDKDTLAKIANMTKSAVNPSGARNSRNFVFQVLSPEKDSQSMPAPSETKVKKAASKQPPAKKPRLERSSSFSQSSIFNHL